MDKSDRNDKSPCPDEDVGKIGEKEQLQRLPDDSRRFTLWADFHRADKALDELGPDYKGYHYVGLVGVGSCASVNKVSHKDIRSQHTPYTEPSP